MSGTIRLGISPCPNDTFAFHGLLSGAVVPRGLRFEIDLLDVERLNERMIGGAYDVCKMSFHGAMSIADGVVVLPTGSALGFGVGPLLLAARHGVSPRDDTQLTLCPGRHTTAALLFAMFHPDTTRIEHVVFSEIMPRLRSGTADLGVCIHEGRFTWKSQGLSLVEDLGARWEEETGCPLPLGGIVASRRLPSATLAEVQRVIHDSLMLAVSDPASALPTMRRHAQETDDGVLMRHVDLYVNRWTVDLGEEGRRSLGVLCDRAGRGRRGRLTVLGDH